MIHIIEQAMGWAPSIPEGFNIGAGYAMNAWLSDYEQALRHAMATNADGFLVRQTQLLCDRVRDARGHLDTLLQQGHGDWRPAAGILRDVVSDAIGVVTSHELNVGLWGLGEAREMEENARRSATGLLRILCRIDPEWARKQEEILDRYRLR